MEFEINKNNELLSKVLSNDKYKKIIIISLLIAIGLIFASNSLKKDEVKQVNAKPEQITTHEYTKELEESLSKLVSSIDGAGDAKVLVTIENGAQTIYATETKKNTEASEDKADGQTTRKQESDGTETKYITVKDKDGKEKALSVTEVQPTVKGVVVVCSGGDDPCVQKRIVNAVTTALNITAKRVCVTK